VAQGATTRAWRIGAVLAVAIAAGPQSTRGAELSDRHVLSDAQLDDIAAGNLSARASGNSAASGLDSSSDARVASGVGSLAPNVISATGHSSAYASSLPNQLATATSTLFLTVTFQ
jgi:hypothetical protein